MSGNLSPSHRSPRAAATPLNRENRTRGQQDLLNDANGQPYNPSDFADWEAAQFWLGALPPTEHREFIHGHTVGTDVRDILEIRGLSETELSASLDGILDNRHDDLPLNSYFIIRGPDFEVLIGVDEQRRPTVTWTRGAQSQAHIDSGLHQPSPRGYPERNVIVNAREISIFWTRLLPEFRSTVSFIPHPEHGQTAVIRIADNSQGSQLLARINIIVGAVEDGRIELPPGRHIYPCDIRTEDGVSRFNLSRYDDLYQADAPKVSKKPKRRTDTPAVHFIDDDVSTVVDPSDSHSTNSSSSVDGEGNGIAGGPPSWYEHEHVAPRPRDVNPGNGESNGHGGGPPPRHGYPSCQWPIGPQPPPAPWSNRGIPAPNQAFHIPVAIPQNRTAHIPFIPAHKWGTLYGPRRPVVHRTPRCAIMASLPAPQFPTPMWQPQHTPLNPDLAGPLDWRIFLPPGASRMSRRGGTGPIMQAPATDPPCFNVAITFENPSLMHWAQRWGPIRVPVHFRAVTVGDVLEAIYEYVSQPLTQTDLAFVVQQDRKKIDEVAVLRQMQGYPHVRTAPQRSDVFGGDVVFGGLALLSMSGQGTYLALRLSPEW